ncbi:hypothetical protein AYO45_06195 [Gammaproteobacteria bacterium SCGC AG-212-F23]|nr:hypothetical protein AYO45_06195 [Gammaproteobacteria bacterium SCGC AG-212-F23]
MKRYHFFQAFYLSFYSRDFYRDVAKNWGAEVVLYLLTFLFGCWLLASVPIQRNIGELYRVLTTHIFSQLPAEIIIEKGAIETTEHRPYLINEPSSKKVIAIIDISGKYHNLDQAKTDLLITKSEIIYRDHDSQVQVKKVSPDWNYHIKSAELPTILKAPVNFAWLILLPFLLGISFAYRLIQAVIYAVFGKVFAVLMQISISYTNVFKLAVMTLTPSILLGTLCDFFSVHIPHLWLSYFMISMGYLIYAVNANRE